MYKAIISDLDGTLTLNSPNSFPSKKVIKAINKVKAEFQFSIATGRTYNYAKEIFSLLDLNAPCVVSGGAQIVNPKNGDVLWEQLLETDIAMKIIKVCQRKSNYIFINNDLIVDEYDYSDKQVGCIFVGEIDGNQSVLLHDEISSNFEIGIDTVPAWKKGTFGFFITHHQATKKHAINKLAGILGVSLAETIGIGDGNNDLSLFELVGYKVAMGNAMAELKQAADLIIPSVDQDGAALFLNNLVRKKGKSSII